MKISLEQISPEWNKKEISYPSLFNNIFTNKINKNQIKNQDSFTFVNDVSFRQNFSSSEENVIKTGTNVIPSYFLNLDSFLNINKYIISSSYSYNSDSRFFEKNLLRLEHPIEDLGSTVAIGDLYFGFNQYDRLSGSPSIKGFGCFNNSLLNPTRSGIITANGSFIIKKKSKVELVNGGAVLYSSIYNPGEYNLYDLPLFYGENDLKLRITKTCR